MFMSAMTQNLLLMILLLGIHLYMDMAIFVEMIGFLESVQIAVKDFARKQGCEN